MKSSSRRHFLKHMAAAAAAATLGCSGTDQNLSSRPPDILFIFTDDQRFDTINALGNEQIITPAMDSIVRGGTAFTNAYIMGGLNGAICCPSRAMLMTGRALFRLPRAITEPWRVPEPEQGISPYITFPELFRGAGYETFGTGKWHNGKRLFAKGFTHGSNIFFGGMSDHYKVPLQEFDPSGDYPDEQTYYREDAHSSELFTDAAVDFLENDASDKPFLMYVSYTAPHDPRDMPDDYLDMYDPEELPLPENFLSQHPFDNGELTIRDEKLAPWPRTSAEIRKHLAAYYAMITHLDAQIGRLLDTLKATGHSENTIIVFAGDNGLAVGRHGLLGKQNLYEHSVHVPLVMSGPGIPAGERRDTFCYLSDIFPTLCEMRGIEPPDTVEGMSFLPALDNPDWQGRDSLFFAYRHFQRAVRTDRWKLIEYNVRTERHTQLFDLAADPHEMTDLSDNPSHADLLMELRTVMADWMTETGDTVDLSLPDWGVGNNQ